MQGVNKPDFMKIYGNEFDAELCEGYYDGTRPDSPNPVPIGIRHIFTASGIGATTMNALER